MFATWAGGRLNDHRPSVGEMFLFSRGYCQSDPVAVIGVPTRS